MRLRLQKTTHSYRKPGFLHIQYTSIHVIAFWKKGLCSRATPRWFWGRKVACSSYRRWKRKQSAQCFSVSFTLELLPIRQRWLPHRYTSPVRRPGKWHQNFLSSWQHTNDFSSPKRTNALLETGNPTITVYLKEEKFLVVFIIWDHQPNF